MSLHPLVLLAPALTAPSSTSTSHCQKYANSPASLNDPHSICTGVDAVAFEVDVPLYRCHQVLHSEAQQLPLMSPLPRPIRRTRIDGAATAVVVTLQGATAAHDVLSVPRIIRTRVEAAAFKNDDTLCPSLLSPTASLDVPPPHCPIPHRPRRRHFAPVSSDPSFRKPSTSLDVSSPPRSVRTRVNDAVVDVDVLLRRYKSQALVPTSAPPPSHLELALCHEYDNLPHPSKSLPRLVLLASASTTPEIDVDVSSHRYSPNHPLPSIFPLRLVAFAHASTAPDLTARAQVLRSKARLPSMSLQHLVPFAPRLTPPPSRTTTHSANISSILLSQAQLLPLTSLHRLVLFAPALTLPEIHVLSHWQQQVLRSKDPPLLLMSLRYPRFIWRKCLR
ncbi:hypothetical protein C8F01DRAFT_1307666 [Mycena amicta]|nr:hypothetical protein C8F01DRAFT_1307666 [Mycena amicta]